MHKQILVFFIWKHKFITHCRIKTNKWVRCNGKWFFFSSTWWIMCPVDHVIKICLIVLFVIHAGILNRFTKSCLIKWAISSIQIYYGKKPLFFQTMTDRHSHAQQVSVYSMLVVIGMTIRDDFLLAWEYLEGHTYDYKNNAFLFRELI